MRSPQSRVVDGYKGVVYLAVAQKIVECFMRIDG